MGWKAGLTVSDARSPDKVRWPGNASCAVSVVVDLSVPGGEDGIRSIDLETERARYGLDVALPRILDLLDRYGVRATFPVPGLIALEEPDCVRRVVDAGHEIACHGLLHEDVFDLPIEQEAKRMDRALTALSDLSGKSPAGWFSMARQTDRYPGGSVSPNTIELLIDRGMMYFGNSQADDVPHYWIVRPSPLKALLALPYSYFCDDQFFIDFPPGPRWLSGTNTERVSTLESNWNEELDAMLGSDSFPGYGRTVTVVIHPYLSGWGQRLLALDRFLERISGEKAIWIPTSTELATYWSGEFPLSDLAVPVSDWRS